MSGRLRVAGVVPPMITPLLGDGRVDIDATRRLAGALVEAGVGGLFVLGSSGEGPWLRADERAEVIRAAVEAASGRVPVLAGVLEPSAARAIEATAQAEDAGADAVVAAAPYYFAADADAQHDHFAAIAAASLLPVLLYNIPSMTHNPLSPATAQALLGVDHIIGIKDSAGDKEAFRGFLALKAERPDYCVLQGAERQGSAALRAGADGLVPGLSNVEPALFVDMVRRAAEGDFDEADRLQAAAAELWQLHSHGFWLECLKFATAERGFGSGLAYGRTARLDEAARAAIRQVLERARA